MPVNENWAEAITEGARNPNNWLARARGLKRSADVLFEKRRTIRPALMQAGMALQLRFQHGGNDREAVIEQYSDLLDEALSYGAPAMMLAGFAVECYLKGILVARDPTVVRAPPILFDKKWDHRLPQLGEKVNINVTEKDAELLERLTTFTTWGGRYPAPKKPGADTRPDESGMGPVHWSDEDRPIIDELIRRLDETLWNEILGKAKKAEPPPAAESQG